MTTRQDKSLHDACAKGHLRKVREILQKNADIANRLDQRIGFLGYTPLHEAACQGHNDILQLLLIYGGNVDAMANGNYTPLHIAASMDYVRCIKVLLKNGANIKALDDFNKTPYQTAIQHRRKDSAKCLKSAEIIRAAGKDQQELKGLLEETSTRDITETCFDDALIEACHRGNFDAACMLLVAGAKKIKESTCISIRNGHYRISALLLVCYAALRGDVNVLEMLLDKSLECYEWLQQFVDESVPIGTVVEKIRESLKNIEDYTSIAIKLPGLGNPVVVLKDLLLNTSCRVKEKKVNWSKLSLSKIDESWLDHIKSWVQFFDLSNNILTSLPECLVDLRMVVRLNLSNNRLKIAPTDLFSMISLRDLNLSGNAIAELPEILQWRPVLKSLNVSDNKLSSLPDGIARSCLETLNLSRNNFTRVPLCVCEIILLRDLDLSDNREINYLPDEMGKLRNLAHINLRNLDQITDPPEQVRQNAEDLVTTLRRKLRNCEPYYTMKLMLVGKGGQGKTTLVHRLRDDFTFKENDLTQGVEISDLSIRRGAFYREYIFKVWDFGGQEDYYATHQCFLSTMSLYLLVWRLIDGENGVADLIPWLDNIAVRSPGSTVIIVGTHLDCISPEQYGSDYVSHMNHMVRELVQKPRYKEKVIVPQHGICAVSCAFGGSRAEVNSLRLLIYDTATSLKKGRIPVMGELIPSSFISLIDRIEKRKTEMQQMKQLPIIRKEEFDAMVKENSLHCRRDIQEPMDVRDATVFLRERGIVMHFDDPNEGLSDLYFIEPRWLCALMARVITIRGHADLVKDGVLEIQETKVLFKSEDLPFAFYDQYVRLLVRFQIVYLLDASRILVPSKLPEKEPEVVTKLQLSYAPVRRVYKIDYQRIHGFWSRFMSRFFFYVKEMIAVDATRYQKAKDSEHGFFGHFCRSCLRVDGSSTRKFSCFMDGAEWETDGKSGGSRGASSGSTSSSNSTTSATSQNTATETKNDPSRKDPTRNDPSGKGTSSKSPSRKDRSKKEPSRKDPSKKEPPRKDPSKKDSSRKESSKKKKSGKKESRRKDPPVKDPSRGEPSTSTYSPSQGNAFYSNGSIGGPAMLSGSLGGNDDFQSLLLDPSVKIFSDDELQDETDGDRIVINQVDTAMDYSRRNDSFHDKRAESVKRVGMDLRIPSFDESLSSGNSPKSSPRSSQKSTISNREVGNYEKQPSDWSGNEKQNDDDGSTSTNEVVPRSESGRGISEDSPSTVDDIPDATEDRPKTSEDIPKMTEEMSRSSEDFPVENGEVITESDHNPTGSENQPKDNVANSTSDRVNPEEILGADQVNIIIDDESIDNIDDISEATDSEYSKSAETTGAIKIPTVGSAESAGNASCLSCSDVCSLSSWKETKGLPSLTTVSSFLEDESFSENMNESFVDNNAQIGTTSVSSSDSHASHNGRDFDINSPPCNREQTFASEVDSRNSVSHSGSTASSARSGEPTDTDCEALSESMSSISTTNSHEPPKIVDSRAKEHSGTQIEPTGSLDCQTVTERLGKLGQTEIHEDQLSQVNSSSPPNANNAVVLNGCPSEDDCQNNNASTEETDNCNSEKSELSCSKDCQNEVNVIDNVGYDADDAFAAEGIQVNSRETNDRLACDDVTDAGYQFQPTESVGEQSERVGEQSESVSAQLESVGEQSECIGAQLEGVGEQSENAGVHSELVSTQSDGVDALSESVGDQLISADEQSESGGCQSGSSEANSGNVGAQSENVGGQSGSVDEQPEGVDPEPETGATKSEPVETQKCTLCKENVPVDQLVTIALDVAELIELKFLHCWLSGVCFTHPDVFLVVAYRPLPDSVVVEIAVSPNPLGRRLLTFVVDHLDTLIKEWYPGLLTSNGAEPTVQKLIPCRSCEKDGKPRSHMFTFDSCVTQYSMGSFVKCPEHEVSIQDIAPDVVLQDIDADLLLQEDELKYERSDANMIGKGGFGKVYRGRCRGREAAIKEYSSPTCEEDAMKRYCEVRNEVNILRRLGQHPYLVNLIGVCLRPFRLVLELAVEGSLAKTLFDPQFQIERVVMYRMLYQVADALSFLHTLTVTYRDLKPQNVLVMSYEEQHDINIKLTDFGTAAFRFNEGLIDLVGTVGYHAPEMLKEFCKRTGYDEKVDIFALGMLVYGFITRRHPFFNINSSAEMNNMIAAGRRPEYDDVIPARIGLAGLTWLMDSCLAYEPNSRHNSSTVAEQLRSTSFQLFLGVVALPCQQSVRHVCLVQTTMELWVAVDDKAATMVFVYDLKNWCLKKTFTINRFGTDNPVLCLQVNCMHVTSTNVLIGLRGDRDVVAIYDAESYKLKAKITLEEPVFSLSSNESYIFLAMSSGVCLVASQTRIIRSIEISHSEAVTCVTAVGNEYLWFTAGKCIQIFQAEGNERNPAYELNAVRFSASSASISQTIRNESEIWCFSRGDSIVTAWDINTRQKTLEVDCKSFLASSESDLLESAVTCVLPVLDTVWIGTGGGKLLIADVTSGDLITSLKLFDDHVRTLTLVPGPGPCATEKYYVAVSGRKIQETALSREGRGKHVCRLNNDVIKPAPDMQTTPVKSADKASRVSRRSPFGRPKIPQSETTKSDVQDSAVNYARGSVLMFFEALPAKVLRRIESK